MQRTMVIGTGSKEVPSEPKEMVVFKSNGVDLLFKGYQQSDWVISWKH